MKTAIPQNTYPLSGSKIHLRPIAQKIKGFGKGNFLNRYVQISDPTLNRLSGQINPSYPSLLSLIEERLQQRLSEVFKAENQNMLAAQKDPWLHLETLINHFANRVTGYQSIRKIVQRMSNFEKQRENKGVLVNGISGFIEIKNVLKEVLRSFTRPENKTRFLEELFTKLGKTQKEYLQRYLPVVAMRDFFEGISTEEISNLVNLEPVTVGRQKYLWQFKV